MPAPHRALKRVPAGQRPGTRRVEQPVPVPGLHALEVKAVAVVEPDRKWVVADALVEPAVTADECALEGSRCADQVTLEENAAAVEAGSPRGSLVEEDGLQARAVLLLEPLRDPAVEEDPCRKRIRQHEPDGRAAAHWLGARDLARSMRAASDRPSSSCARSASGGVPHAGQPSTPNAVTRVLPSSARRSPSARPPTGA